MNKNKQERIAKLTQMINKQIDDLAEDKSRQIRNVYICEDGKILPIEEPDYLAQKVDDDMRKLGDMLRTLDSVIRSKE